MYLLFSDDSLLPLDEWVFNTEAHPFPIKGKNPLYRATEKTVYAEMMEKMEESRKHKEAVEVNNIL